MAKNHMAEAYTADRKTTSINPSEGEVIEFDGKTEIDASRVEQYSRYEIKCVHRRWTPKKGEKYKILKTLFDGDVVIARMNTDKPKYWRARIVR